MTGLEQEIHKLIDEADRLKPDIVAVATINTLKRLSRHMEGVVNLKTLEAIHKT